MGNELIDKEWLAKASNMELKIVMQKCADYGLNNEYKIVKREIKRREKLKKMRED